MRQFARKDMVATKLLIERLDDTVRPDFGSSIYKTAYELYESVAFTYQPSFTVDIKVALRAVTSVRMRENLTLQYCEEFALAVRQYNNASEQAARSAGVDQATFGFGSNVFTTLFKTGTGTREWLRSWKNAYPAETTTVDELMRTLRLQKPPFVQQPRNNGSQSMVRYNAAAAAAASTIKPADLCTQCTHHVHSNADCFRQHPENAPNS